MKKMYWITALVYVVFLALVVLIGFALPLSHANLILFCVAFGVVGLIAVVLVVIYLRRSAQPPVAAGNNPADAGNLFALVHAAEARLKKSPGIARSLGSMPLIYLLGDENAGKTHTVLQSGLDAELIAGEVQRDGIVVPTALANFWYTPGTAFVEAGGALLRQPALFQSLIRLTQPSKLGSAFNKGGLQPTRAAILCVSIERLLEANDKLHALGQMLNSRLKMLSEELGISLPVYVLLTKLDRISSFTDFAVNLTEAEVREALGTMLAQIDTGAGLYGERAAFQVGQRLDEICYMLSEFRLEVLSRGGEPPKLAKAFEFPRDLRKLRSRLVNLLVEIGRPSQLAVNPFLRGFYFSGLRPRAREDSATAPAQRAPRPQVEEGATHIFRVNSGAAPAIAPPAPRGSRVPQWVFLPHLFTQIILADRSALESSRASTKVSALKRALIAASAACIFLYCVALTVSYFNNAQLESRLKEAANLPISGASEPTQGDLANLDKLRAVFADIAGYRRNGAPLAYTFGLYPGDRLYRKACDAYGNRFRTTLLSPAQKTIVAMLSNAATARRPGDEYNSIYGPLRAYLITTSDPTESTADFEPEALQEAWVAGRALPSAITDLSLAQFQAYSNELPQPKSCMAALGGKWENDRVSSAGVASARAYLNGKRGPDQVYLSIKAAADRRFKGILFNADFATDKPFVSDDYPVEGAFTRGGFDFVQAAIRNPDEYAKGEVWVLGPQSGPPIDARALSPTFATRYHAEFLAAWRNYLKSAKVVEAGSLPEAGIKLRQLDGNQSALLQMFLLISQNTAVPDPTFSEAFKAPQLVIAPTAKTLEGDSSYMSALAKLDTAIHNYNGTPGAQTQIGGAALVNTEALSAESAVTGLSSRFPHDVEADLDDLTAALLRAPIHNAKELANKADGNAAGGSAAAVCAQIDPILKEFPFTPGAPQEASMADAARVFQPGTGLIATYAQASQLVKLEGSMYIPIPGAPAPSRSFMKFLSDAQTVANALFPSGGGPPTIAFTLTQETVPGLPPATLDIDGRKLTTPNSPTQFEWHPLPSSAIQLSSSGGQSLPYNGQWSLFHFAYLAKRSRPNTIEEVFQINGQPQTAAGVELDYKYDVSGSGAQLLNPAFMKSLHCEKKVAQ